MNISLKPWPEIAQTAWSTLWEDPTIFPKEAFNFLRQRLILWHSINHKYETSDGLPKLIEVDPDEIEYLLQIRRAYLPTSDKLAKKYGAPNGDPVIGVMGGSWDALKSYWYDHRLMRSIRSRYQRGVDWQDTEYYQYWESQSDSPQKYADMNERVRDLDRLYHSMKKNGYLSQKDLVDSKSGELSTQGPTMEKIDGELYPGECRVGIGRDGEIIRLRSAKHRVTLAKILNLEKIPVIVLIRHSKWRQVREAYKSANSRGDIPRKYRKHWNHPDLSDVQP